MTTGTWNDEDLGTAKRVGHYLATQVGEGQVFEKSTLRAIIPDIEQVDRRMRDLRKVGWTIRTYKDMAHLRPNQLFLERIGERVWEMGYRWPRKALSAARRREVLDRDGSHCKVCGIDFGAEYPDRPGVIARPTIGHIIPRERGGTDDPSNLRPECQFCNEPARNLTAPAADVELLKREMRELRREDKRRLQQWIQDGSRTYTRVERLWAKYRQLPQPAQQEVSSDLSSILQGVP